MLTYIEVHIWTISRFSVVENVRTRRPSEWIKSDNTIDLPSISNQAEFTSKSSWFDGVGGMNYLRILQWRLQGGKCRSSRQKKDFFISVGKSLWIHSSRLIVKCWHSSCRVITNFFHSNGFPLEHQDLVPARIHRLLDRQRYGQLH